MKIVGPVLAATALDPAGDEVIRQAASLAEAAGVALIVAHVVPEIYGIRPLFPQLREADRPYAESVHAAAVAAAEAQARRVAGDQGPPRQIRVEAGSPHAMLIQLAEEIGAGLVVVGAGSHEQGASLGGVAERVIRHAHCPVLVARAPAGAAVLAATDFSDPALPAIEAGRDEARRRGHGFVILHAVEVRVIPAESPEGSQAILLAHVIRAETERARLAMAEVVERHGPVAEAVVCPGPPADAILETAARLPADLIVVGTHGRTGLKRLTLGSVAETVVRRARCSVLVVRLAG